jgi:hypothetical protein
MILACGLSFLVIHWPQGKNATFSKHAAAQRITIIYYIVLFAAVLPLLLLFFIYWLTPTFRLSPWFIIFGATSELLQHAVTLIPELAGRRAHWHRALTGLSAALLPLMLVVVIAAPYVSNVEKMVTGAGIITMLGIASYHRLSSNKAEPHNELILQAVYYGTFFVVILVLTYMA